MKVAVLSAAHVHTPSYVQEMKSLDFIDSIVLYDDDGERGRKFAADMGIEFSDTPEGALKGAEAALICSENSMKLHYAREVADYNIPLLCEKPLALNMDEADRIVDMYKGRENTFYMAHPVRSMPVSVKLREMVKSGEIGDLVSAVGTNHGTLPDGWFREKDKAGGGAIMDHGVHIIDVMRLVSGSEVKAVYAEGGNGFHNLDIEDSVQITMEFENGMLAGLDPSYSRGTYFPTWGDVRLTLHGTRRSVDTDMLSQVLDVFSASKDKTHRFAYYGSNMDYHLITDFFKTLAGKETENPMATLVDGYRELEILMAAYESIRTGKRIETGKGKL